MSSDYMQNNEVLTRIEIFKELSGVEINELKKIIEERDFHAGEAIITEGERGDTMYMILSGDVEVQKKTIDGDEYTCDYLPEAYHCFFGEFSLLDSGPRSATVRAVTNVETLVIKRKSFEKLCEDNMVIGYKLFKAISMRLISRLRKADSDILILFEALVDEVGRGNK